MRTIAAPLTALALLSLASTARSAEWITPPTAYAAVTPSALSESTARAFLQTSAPTLGLERVTLERVGATTSADGAWMTVRFEQRFGGLRVVDRGVNVRLGAGGRVTGAVLEVARDLSVPLTPDLDVAQATAVAANAVGRALVVEKSELAVLGRDAGVLVWMLDVRDAAGGTRYLVDAHGGGLVGRWSLGADALGRVYEVSSVTTPTPTDHDLATLDTTQTPIVLDGWGGLLTVTNYVSGSSQNGFTVEQTVVPSSGQDFLYDPPSNPLDPTDAFAQVNLFYHLTNMRDFFTGLGVDQTAAKWKITAVANAEDDHQPLDNAFFTEMGQSGTFAAPNLIAIGQGSVSDFAYDSDVFKHEFGHYVTHNTVNYNLGNFYTNAYGLSPHSGSIDEGIADYFACSDNDDPTLGEASLGPLGAERHLDDTHKRCPDDMVGEVHADGEIIGSLSWTLRTDLGQSKADRVVWGAITLLTPGATFGDFGRALTQSASDLLAAGQLVQADVDKVKADIAARGVDDCDPVIAIDGTKTRTVNVIGLDLIGQFIGGNCQTAIQAGAAMQSLFHFSRATVASDQAVRFHVDAVAENGGDVAISVFVRKGSHVGFGNGGGFLPTPKQFDAKFDLTGSGDVLLDATTMTAFEPGATYYVAITSTSCPNLKLTVGASNVDDPPATSAATTSSSSGAGGGADGSGGNAPVDKILDRGCGCELGGREAPSGWLALAASVGLGGAFVRRRRGSRSRTIR